MATPEQTPQTRIVDQLTPTAAPIAGRSRSIRNAAGEVVGTREADGSMRMFGLPGAPIEQPVAPALPASRPPSTLDAIALQSIARASQPASVDPQLAYGGYRSSPAYLPRREGMSRGAVALLTAAAILVPVGIIGGVMTYEATKPKKVATKTLATAPTSANKNQIDPLSQATSSPTAVNVPSPSTTKKAAVKSADINAVSFSVAACDPTQPVTSGGQPITINQKFSGGIQMMIDLGTKNGGIRPFYPSIASTTKQPTKYDVYSPATGKISTFAASSAKRFPQITANGNYTFSTCLLNPDVNPVQVDPVTKKISVNLGNIMLSPNVLLPTQASGVTFTPEQYASAKAYIVAPLTAATAKTAQYTNAEATASNKNFRTLTTAPNNTSNKLYQATELAALAQLSASTSCEVAIENAAKKFVLSTILSQGKDTSITSTDISFGDTKFVSPAKAFMNGKNAVNNLGTNMAQVVWADGAKNLDCGGN